MGETITETDGVARENPPLRVWDLKLFVIYHKASANVIPFTNAPTANGAIQQFLHKIRPNWFPPFPVGGQLVGRDPEAFWEEVKVVKGVDVKRCLVSEAKEVEDV